MSYVLVSVFAEEDDATRASDAFAGWVIDHRRPSTAFRARAPDRDQVRAAVVAIDPRTAFVLGHGCADGLGPTRTTAWVTPEQFGDVFCGSRAYCFACDISPRFAEAAVEAGVTAVLGHDGRIEAPAGEPDFPPEVTLVLRTAMASAAFRFLDGCDDETELRQIVAGYDVPIEEIAIPADPTAAAAAGARNAWAADVLLQRFGRTMRLHRAATADRHGASRGRAVIDAAP